jgi:hypothetical protein
VGEIFCQSSDASAISQILKLVLGFSRKAGWNQPDFMDAAKWLSDFQTGNKTVLN